MHNYLQQHSIKILFMFFILITYVSQLKTYAQEPPEAALAEEYYNDGEYEKAIELFQKVIQQYQPKEKYIFRITDAYLKINQANQALDFLARWIKKQPEQPLWSALRIEILEKTNKKETAEINKQTDILLNKLLKTNQDFAAVGKFYTDRQEYEKAKNVYLKSRKTLKCESCFSNELVGVYSAMGNYDLAAGELMQQYLENPSQLPGIRTAVTQLTTPENAPAVEKALLAIQQKNQNDIGLREILYDFYLQAGMYDDALLQAKALDRQLKESGERLYRLAFALQTNRQYQLSNEALDYIIKTHKNSPYYLQAFFEKARNFELQAFERKPLDTTAINACIKNYDDLFEQFGRQEAFANAIYRKANLCIFYKNDLAEAARELEHIEKLSLPAIAKAEAQLLQADIKLIQGDWNQARLKYAEVEERFKEGQIGAMAKFRSAKLAYFKGDFEMAKARLKTLKDNTSDDIANDAISLFLLIQDNSGLDSNTNALKEFAEIQLLIYQKQYEKALPLLDSILYRFPNHPLTDDILWEKANIFLAKNNIEPAIVLIDKIIKNYPTSVLFDDALFTKAELYQYTLNNPQEAQKLYMELLVKCPASLLKVEARKRIRKLRGEETRKEN